MVFDQRRAVADGDLVMLSELMNKLGGFFFLVFVLFCGSKTNKGDFQPDALAVKQIFHLIREGRRAYMKKRYSAIRNG
jgi:hypothetical protein